MIKQIEVTQLRPGMFLHGLEGPWTEHPFWRSSFKLSDGDLDKLRKTSISKAWIDTDRGPDVEASRQTPPTATGYVPHDTATAFMPAVSKFDIPDREVMPTFAVTQPMPIDTPEVNEIDMKHAGDLCVNAKAVLKTVFADARLGRAIDSEQCTGVVAELVDQVMEDPAALIVMALLKNHDDYTYTHSVSVCALMAALGRTLGFNREQMTQAGMSGLMHDVGKAFIPVSLLAKPGSLTQEEYRLVQTHTLRGHKLLTETFANTHPMVLDVCLHHHERINGTGYPHGLKGERISLFAKMAAVCDVYDALTSERVYKRKMDPGAALRAMGAASGHFDQTVYQAFVKTVGIYPVGTLVRLKSETLAVVVAQDPDSLIRPHLRVFYSLKDRAAIKPRRISLLREPDEAIVGVEAANAMDVDLSLVQHMWAPSDVAAF